MLDSISDEELKGDDSLVAEFPKKDYFATYLNMLVTDHTCTFQKENSNKVITYV